MKLKFEKNKEGEIVGTINGEDFSTKDYIKMIKELKDRKKIEVYFGEGISPEDRSSVESMIEDINNIKKESNETEE